MRSAEGPGKQGGAAREELAASSLRDLFWASLEALRNSFRTALRGRGAPSCCWSLLPRLLRRAFSSFFRRKTELINGRLILTFQAFLKPLLRRC